jgi:hypothetical protein
VRVLKKTGHYLRVKAAKNFLLAISCVLVFGVLFVSALPGFWFYVDLGSFWFVRLILLFVTLVLAAYFYGQTKGYLRGYSGEKVVSKTLSSGLGDDYLLINDAGFKDGFGNIDHIVVGPNGVFVIETKNYAGKVICHGDEWSRKPGRSKRSQLQLGFNIGSPSRQVKRNVGRVRRAVIAVEGTGLSDVWVDGVLVFSNPAVDLEVHEPSVTILKVRELVDFIRLRKIGSPLSSSEVSSAGKGILGQLRRD